MNRKFMGFQNLSLICLVILLGCRNIGIGVVLWPSENSNWAPGDIVRMRGESILRDTYIVSIPNGRNLREEIDKWRIKEFNGREEAEEYAANLEEWKHVYAECLHQSLPMRSEPSNISNRIFSFREGELVKVLGRTSESERVGNLEGYWYRVLAEGGVEGYVFDYYLRVTRTLGDRSEILNERKFSDSALVNLLRAEWRPSYFETMLASNQIDLERFRPEYGLFFDPERNKITLRNSGISIDESWAEIIPTGQNQYAFLDTSFRITLNSDKFISVQYLYKGKDYLRAFVHLNQDVEAVIAREMERRKAALNRMVQLGPVFYSRIYGEFTVQENGTFAWSRKSALISEGIISSEAGNTGMIKFDHFVKPSIAAEHNGAFSLEFSSGEIVQFLYAFEGEELRLLHVPKNVINQRLIMTDQYIRPVRSFFTRLPLPED